MNEHPWSILAEFTDPSIPVDFEQASNTLRTATQALSLPETFLGRLNSALLETLTKHLQHPNGERVQIRILSNFVDSQTKQTSASWGFFFIEKDQAIELYLYQDGK